MGDRGRGQSSSSLVTSSGFHSLDRRQGREGKTGQGRYTSISTALGSEEAGPPEILVYKRPPENLTSPVRESNGYLPEDTSLTLSPEPGSVQRLFLDSVLQSSRSRSRSSRCSEQEVTSSPEQEHRPGSRRFSRSSQEGGRRSSSSTANQLVRKSSRNGGGVVGVGGGGVGSTARHAGESRSVGGGRGARRSVMTVLRQSFRRSKKDKPAPAVARPGLQQSLSVTPPNHSPGQESSRFDYSSISVASVRTGRTLTPSRASIVSRGSLGSRSLRGEETSLGSSLRVQANLKQVLNSESKESVGEMSASIKTVNPETYSMVGRSRTSPVLPSPVANRPRCLPETPKLLPTSVPPIYANVQQQLASGNSRQLSGIAKILEDTAGNKRPGENGVQKSASLVAQGPPAIPKPAARLSIRQKVETARTRTLTRLGNIYI